MKYEDGSSKDNEVSSNTEKVRKKNLNIRQICLLDSQILMLMEKRGHKRPEISF
jgi:hypothetical protein